MLAILLLTCTAWKLENVLFSVSACLRKDQIRILTNIATEI